MEAAVEAAVEFLRGATTLSGSEDAFRNEGSFDDSGWRATVTSACVGRVSIAVDSDSVATSAWTAVPARCTMDLNYRSLFGNKEATTCRKAASLTCAPYAAGYITAQAQA